MGEQLHKPAEKTKTQDLADRVMDSAEQGSNVSAFHDEIHSLSKGEQLQFAKDLDSNAINYNGEQAVKGTGKRIQPDSTIDKSSGELLDIDLVISQRSGDGNVTATKEDLLTNDQKGEKYDKEQELERKLKPYEHLYYMYTEQGVMAERSDRAFLDDNSQFEKTDPRDVAFNQASRVMKLYTDGDPDQAAMVDLLRKRTVDRPDDSPYEQVGSISSMFAREDIDSGAPPEVKQLLKDVLAVNMELRESDPIWRINDARRKD
ncbi:hypothetical protein KF913_09290 [Candidatus Obscuribacterales bacterium]|nr:hypothetical protein [Candidatus Obscuribacterales bacterium]